MGALGFALLLARHAWAAQAGELGPDQRRSITVGLADPARVRALLTLTPEGQRDGFAARVVAEGAELVGLRAQFVDLDDDDGARALGEHAVDAIAALDVTADSLRTFDFTVPLLVCRGAVFANADAPAVATVADLRRGRVAVARAGAGHAFCIEHALPAQAQDTLRDALLRTRAGEFDYVVTTQFAGRWDIELHGIGGLVEHVLDEPGPWSTFAVAARHGDQELIARLNKGIALLRDSGRYDELYDEWIDRYQPRVRSGVTLRLVAWAAGIVLGVVLCAALWQFLLRRELTHRTRALGESEARYRAITDSLPGLVYTYFVARDGTSRRVFASSHLDEWRARFPALDPGADEHAVLGAVHADDRAAFELAAQRSRAADERFEHEFRLRADDGEYCWVHWIATPFPREHGVLWQALLLDVTPLRSAELERRQLEAQLAQAQRLEGLGLLAGGIAHDFNNLLVGVAGNVDLALMSLAEPASARARLEEALKATQRAADLTHQLLAYAGRAKLSEETIDLGDAAREMVGLLGTSLTQRARLELELASGLAPVLGDATRLRQMIMNLLTNACDALPAGGGRIVLRTGALDCDHDYLARDYVPSDAEPGEFVFVEVEDDGCGMDEATLARIFDPFFTTKPTGRGLGLSMVIKTIQRQRGAVKVRSTPGRGTTFRLLFPPARTSTVARAAPPDHAHGRGAGRVLVVDDERAVSDVTRTMLELRGWSVETAGDAEQVAGVFARGSAFDVVLLDVTLSSRSGVGVLHELRAQRPGLAVVLMSGYSEEAALDGVDEIAPDGFLQKPFTAGALASALEAAIARRRAVNVA